MGLRPGSSPLSRGIPITSPVTPTTFRIIPALAGNTLRKEPDNRRIRDHPRSRGEYPRGGLMPYSMLGSSPLSRGIRSRACWFAPVRGIIPALAGNTVAHSDGFATEGDHPRSRGEYNKRQVAAFDTHGSSPLSRGLLTETPVPHRQVRIIPALAGNT